MKKFFRILKKALLLIGLILSVLLILLILLLLKNNKEQARQQALMVKPDGELLGIRLQIPRENAESVNVNFYPRDTRDSLPLVINLHGGAFVAGDADTLDTQSDRISQSWNVCVATVNYRLATDGYDIAYGTQEVVDTVKYFITHAEEYAIDTSKIVLLGYSAGGYHAMSAVLALREAGIDVAGQIICYGFIKDIADTYTALDETLQKTTAPALFLLADNDPISDGSLTYQQLLDCQGVPTQVKKFDGAIHGFLEENNPEYEPLNTSSKSPEQELLAREAEDFIGTWLNTLLDRNR